MGIIKRALRRTSRKLLSKIIPPTHSHQLVLNPPAYGSDPASLAVVHGGSGGGGGGNGGKRKLASLQRRLSGKKSHGSKDEAVAEALLLAVKNHLPPLQFHHVHGPHAQLSANKCVARRTQSFCQALVFSNRVILPNERVYIKVLEISKCWSGTIRFGFTAVDPATLARRMPKHACPDMTNAGHTWARALADEVVRRNSVIHFSYNKHGLIHYGINNQDCGVFHANVATSQNLWFIVDIYGLTAAVELIDPRVNGSSGQQLRQQQAASLATTFKSTSAMDELFGTGPNGGASASSGRRKKLSRRHARHAALIQQAATGYWPPPLDAYHQQHPEAAANSLLWAAAAGGQPAQLPNLNSLALPSAQQNIYSPMPSAAPLRREQQQQQQQHDYHQIMAQAPAYQPLRSVSMANISGAPSSSSSSSPSATAAAAKPSRARDAPQSAAISQADLSQQLDNLHLYERRMRRQQAKLAGAATPAAANTSNQAPPVARTRQHLREINANARADQQDKGASAAAAAASSTARIVSGKPAAGSSKTAPSASAATLPPPAGVRTKSRHSISASKTQRTAAAAAAAARDNNGREQQAPSKDCPICFERPINCVLYQCGHMCTCYECGVKQWKTQSRSCPICRTTIKDVIKTYMS